MGFHFRSPYNHGCAAFSYLVRNIPLNRRNRPITGSSARQETAIIEGTNVYAPSAIRHPFDNVSILDTGPTSVRGKTPASCVELVDNGLAPSVCCRLDASVLTNIAGMDTRHRQALTALSEPAVPAPSRRVLVCHYDASQRLRGLAEASNSCTRESKTAAKRSLVVVP